MGETNVGRIEKTVPFIIKKTGRSLVKFPIKLNPAGVGKLIALILKGKTIVFTIKGTGESSGIKFAVYKKIPLM